ncbi:MAG: DNA gyrase/topoisomerase IV subunit A, partial [Flavobacteriaceae bacterium]
QRIDALEADLAQVKHDLANLTDFAISYFKHLKQTYGKGRERKTEIRVFDDVDAKKVVIRNTKLYVNREEGFVGTSLRRDEYVTDCADIDDIIVFTADGKMTVTKVEAKTFIRKNIIHVAVFKKKDDRTIYNMIYRDGRAGTTYMKRFPVTSVTRDKEYDLTNGNAQSKVFYFSANPNGEAEIVTVLLRQSKGIKKLKWDVDFANLDIKSRGVRGNTVTKYTVNRIELKEEGVSTLKPRDIWFDETVGRLNVDGRGDLIGAFRGDDRLLIATQSGVIKTAIPDLNMHFPEDMLVLEKWEPSKPISVIYFDTAKERYFGKRFVIDAADKEEQFIKEGKQSQLELINTDYRPVFEIEFAKPRGKDPKPPQQISFEDFIAVKGIKAIGNQVTSLKVKQFNVLDPLPYENTIEETPADIEVEDPQTVSKENDDDAQITLDL